MKSLSLCKAVPARPFLQTTIGKNRKNIVSIEKREAHTLFLMVCAIWEEVSQRSLGGDTASPALLQPRKLEQAEPRLKIASKFFNSQDKIRHLARAGT